MNSPTGLIAPLVQSFFTDHLVRQRRASPQTVASYRDTFRLLIQHLSQTTGKKPSDLTLDDLQAKAIMRFLDGIERDRGNSVQMLDQQSKCISVACHSLWTGTALADQMISKEGLHQRRDQPRAAVHKSPPGSQERRKASPAAVNNSGVAVKYQ